MQRDIVVIQHDLQENIKKIIYQGKAEIKEDTLIYQDKDGLNSIWIQEEKFEIKRQTESPVVINGELNQFGQANIVSPYGEINFQVKCFKLEKALNYWQIEYQLFQEGTVVLHTLISWRFR